MSTPAEIERTREHSEFKRVIGAASVPNGEAWAILAALIGPATAEVAGRWQEQAAKKDDGCESAA